MENVVKMLDRAVERTEPRRASESVSRKTDDFDKLLREKTERLENADQTGGSQASRKTTGREQGDSGEQDAAVKEKISQETDEPGADVKQAGDLTLLQMALPYQTMALFQNADVQPAEEAVVQPEVMAAVPVPEGGIPSGEEKTGEPVPADVFQGVEPEGNREAPGALSQEKAFQKEDKVQTFSLKDSGEAEILEKAEVKPMERETEGFGESQADKGAEEAFLAAAGVQAGERMGTAQNSQPAPPSRQAETGRWQEGEPVHLKTAENTLPKDLGDVLGPGLLQKKGELTVELEPASLGKLTIKVVYEAGRASVSIAAANPKTLEMLNEKAGELAGILEEKTGQTTIVYTQASQQDNGEYPADQDGRKEGQDRRQDGRQNRQESDNFAQQLRLGLV